MNNTQTKTTQPSSSGTKEYELNITIIRHGPKDGFAGPITETSKGIIRQHFASLYQSLLINAATLRQLVSSPIERAKETALIFEEVMRKEGISPVVLEIDDRLSENNLIDFRDSLSPSLRKDWFRYWYRATERPEPEIAIGKEGINKFAEWILEKLHDQQQRGGCLRIDAFSHGPLMAGFILQVEEKIGKEILSPLKHGQDKLEFDKLFGSKESEFGYLGQLNLFASSFRKEELILTVGGKPVIVAENTLLAISKDKP